MEHRNINIPASYLIIMKEGKILLLRRYNTGYEDGKYSFIAGHVDPGENFTDCIVREAQEEAGIIIDRKDLHVIHMLHRKKDDIRVEAFFIADTWTWEIINKEPHKCDDLSWFPIDTIPKNTIPYIRHVIEEVRKGNTYSEFGWN